MNQHQQKYWQTLGLVIAGVLVLILLLFVIKNKKVTADFLLQKPAPIIEIELNSKKNEQYERIVRIYHKKSVSALQKTRELGIINELEQKEDEPLLEGIGWGFLINDRQIVTAVHLVDSDEEFFWSNQNLNEQKIINKTLLLHKDLALLDLEGPIVLKSPLVETQKSAINMLVKIPTINEGLLDDIKGKVVSEPKKIATQRVWGEILSEDFLACEVEIQSNLGDSGKPIFNEKNEVVGIIIGIDLQNEQIAYMAEL